MACNVVAISRTLGAGGESLGTVLAEKLGFRYVDSEIIQLAAEKAGVSNETIAQAEARRGLLARILDTLAIAGAATVATTAAPDAVLTPDQLAPSYEQFIVEVIRATAEQGNVVIVAHGASIPLAGMPGLLRVMVTASPEVRARRIAGESAGDAAKAVADSDKARADYFRRFYGVDRELPTHYDIVLNTDTIDVDQATEAVLALAR